MSRALILSLVGKVAGIALARRSLRDSAPLMQQMLVGIAAVVALAVVVALLVSALLLGLVYMIYQCLVAHGTAPAVAQLQMAGGVIVLIGILLCVLRARVEKLKDMPASLITMQSPVSRAQGLYAAFMDGLAPAKPDGKKPDA